MGPRPPIRRTEFAGGQHGSGNNEVSELISKQKLTLLAKDIDSCTILEDDVIDLLLKLSEDFIDTVVQGSCSLGMIHSLTAIVIFICSKTSKVTNVGCR